MAADTESEIAVDVATQEAVLQLRGVSKSFGGVHALKDVSLDAQACMVHALLGENGAGKSTLMGVASGSTQPDAGEIRVNGELISTLTPDEATRLGIAIVHQRPAVLPDMTVAENIRVAIPAAIVRKTSDERAWMKGLLARVGCTARLQDRVDGMSVAQRQLLEMAKALALDPRVLILDEPTAPLGADQVEPLFEEIRRSAAAGTAVIYITHRLAEVRRLADHVTVLRDGKRRGDSPVSDITDDELLQLIVGRELSSTFPPKRPPADDAAAVLAVEDLSGEGFRSVSLSARGGEIVGLAGIVGNGQSDFLRALAGIRRTTGTVKLDGVAASRRSLLNAAAYLPADRHRDGLMTAMSLRENAAVSSLPALSQAGVMMPRREREAVRGEMDRLSIKASSMDADVMSLSGGNQQKVVLARALMSGPRMLLADEPTQGVDVGARSEIYRIMRDVADTGVPVVVASSDATELEGLCDRVLVFSRGEVVAELTGDAVTENDITRAVVNATTHRESDVRRGPAKQSRLAATKQFMRGDYAPSIILALVIVVLGAYTYSHNSRYLAAFNVTSVLTLLSALAFVSLGQAVVIMTGGIDLSLGPLAGLLVVISSFYVTPGHSAILMAAAFLLMLAVSLVSGLTNGLLVRFGGFTPVAATLTLYIGLQGISLFLRPFQGGFISTGVTDAITKSVGEIPIAFIVVVLVAIGLEWCLRSTRWGRELRAVGSDEGSAHRLGVRVNRTFVLSYVAAGGLTFLGAVLLMAQIGVGDPTQGVTFTLSSITAVVLGGASLLGGRGSFIGALLGAALIQQILNATTFLNLSQAYQFFFQGILILIAAAIYTQAKNRSAAVTA